MSLTSNDITAKNFKKFFTALSPYLGSYDKGKLTFVGEVKAFFAETAPNGFLICDGATYNKADYPQLANLLLSLTDHSAYEVSGDDTKFKVPDLRGEFLRGSGTNSHTNQGSGAGVGVHQDGTIHYSTGTNEASSPSATLAINTPSMTTQKVDNGSLSAYMAAVSASKSSGTDDRGFTYTSRPTNTSVLYCIAYKDTMVDIDFLSYGGERFAKSDMYDTNERVIGKWIDGRPLYQKVVDFGTFPNATTKNVAHNIANVEMIRISDYVTANGYMLPFPRNGDEIEVRVDSQNISIKATGNWSWESGHFTVQYTKTTDTADSFKYSTPTDYSTEEKIVGTWIDGRPIYQKTIDLGQDTQISTTEWTSIGLSLNTFGVITSAIGNTSTDFRYCPILCARISDELKVKIIRSDGSQYMSIRYITLQYTKTTDA